MYTVYVLSCEGKGAFDVSTLAHDMTYTSSITGQPGKLTMTLEKDPNGVLSMTVGDKVIFLDEKGSKVFNGKIFTLSTEHNGTYSVTAYDQMRYLQNHDYLYLDGETNKNLQDIFTKICTQGEFTYSIKAPAMTALDPHLFVDQSYFDMLSWCIDETMKKSGKMYFVRDSAGVLELNEVKTNYGVSDSPVNIPEAGLTGPHDFAEVVSGEKLVIGDKSLLTDYRYEMDIDKQTCTEVILTESVKNSSANSDKDKTDKRLVYAEVNPENGAKWGRLRKIVNVKEQATEDELKEYAKLVLDVYSRPFKTMRLEALGYPLYAGDGFKLSIDRLGINMDMYVTEVTHTYGEIHTMSLSVAASDALPDSL